MPDFEIITATAPSAWGAYLINGDATGLEGDDESNANAFVAAIGCGSPVSCDDAGFMWYSRARDLGCGAYGADCQTYTFLKRIV